MIKYKLLKIGELDSNIPNLNKMIVVKGRNRLSRLVEQNWIPNFLGKKIKIFIFRMCFTSVAKSLHRFLQVGSLVISREVHIHI